MSIMEKVFGAFNKPQAPAPAPAAPTNNPAQNTPNQQAAPGNGVVPQGSGNPPEDQSPLAKFQQLWETPPEDPNKKPAHSVTQLDPQEVMKSAAKVDFTKAINPELLQKIQAGGDDAMNALVQAMNSVTQLSYAQSTVAASKLVEQALSQAEERFTSRLPSLINQRTASEALIKQNKQLADPAVAPIVQLVQDQLALKFPSATSQELADMAQEMMSGAAKVFSPAPKETPSKTKKSQDEDWDSWASQ